MKRILACISLLLFALVCLAQQPPPADGVGLGNDHLSPNSTDSNVPSMSPDQNSAMTDTTGSVSGDKGTPAFAGSSGANTASTANSEGRKSVAASTSATATRRESYGLERANSEQKSTSSDKKAKTSATPAPPQ